MRDVLVRLAAVIAVGAMAALGAAAEETAPEDQSEARIATTMTDTDRMLASVRIGASGPYPFIIDTAAERSVIAQQLARELNLAPSGAGRLLSMTNTRAISMVDAPDVSFGMGAPRDLRVFALNGDHIGAAGVLGIDALRGQRVVLDFEASEMRVGPAPRALPSTGPNDIVVRGRARFGQLVLIDSSAEGVAVDVIVDSGLQTSIGNQALRRLLVTRQNNFEPLLFTSITGEEVTADYTLVDNLRIGGVAIRRLPVAFADTHFFRRMDMTRRPALLLGMDALEMFRRVTVDFRNRRAHFLLPEDTPVVDDAG